MDIPDKVCIPNGINVSEQIEYIGSEIEKSTYAKGLNEEHEPPDSCSYLFIHNSKVAAFTDKLTKDGIRFFIHKSVIYRRNKQSRGIQMIEKPTVSGLIFLQGTVQLLQDYLAFNFPGHHLVNNCSTHQPAVISDKIMAPFMRVLETSPERVRFLLHPFSYYAGGNTKLRITSGSFSGLEGYIIRIDRDRRLVMDIGGMSVAISGMHCERFEVVEDGIGIPL